MLNKALVEIVLPAAGTTYDVFLPLDSRMSEVVMLVAALLSDLSDGKFKARPDAMLCDAHSGTILDINRSVAELGIKNGSRLLLI
ncbi:hypothetical protein PCCS19_51590 [Paenibacillus sp. CCS19]|uniref:EsaB/YukD family protein n=1 Tax=Paenibacillus sp. CCS19 TaxID=3158387 RepID=UPI00256D8EDC|nr:EsaB/YukD family protein [Paenibacillus cellulosilyticus]GMK42100.1 hypothetical protein PCCS19_51590 [Paenibacillus cellulosilyticus]